jgi:hypothetical protein
MKETAVLDNGRVVAGSRHGHDRVTAWEQHGMCELAFNTAAERHGMCESAIPAFITLSPSLYRAAAQHGTLPPIPCGPCITLRHTTVCRYPLDE